MKYEIIASGSDGNAVLLDNRILIDCGVSYKALRKVEKKIEIVLLTHRHGDHFRLRTIEMLAFNNPRIWFIFATDDIANLLAREIVPASRRLCVPYGKQANMLNCSVEPREIPHDVPNTAWIIRTANGSAIYATDTNDLSGLKAPSLDLYLIEANYEQWEIEERARAALSKGDFVDEFRTAKTHLSLEQANEWLEINNKHGGEVVYLHQHKEKL